MRSGVQTIIANEVYSGDRTILMLVKQIHKERLRAALVSSTDINDVAQAAHWLQAIGAMKGAKVVVFRDGNLSKSFSDLYGSQVIQLSSAELRRRFETIDDRLSNQ